MVLTVVVAMAVSEVMVSWMVSMSVYAKTMAPRIMMTDTTIATMRATSELPVCPSCGALTRPNILMFGDGSYIPPRQIEQNHAYDRWVLEAPTGSTVATRAGFVRRRMAGARAISSGNEKGLTT